MTNFKEYQLQYRPSTLEGIVGQKSVVTSLKSLFDANRIPHSICFSGPSGTGKTTLARIVAKRLNCDINNIIELDAATHTGVDDMRGLMGDLKYRGLGGNPLKFIILDEAHMLSRSAWNSLLKIVEEPPPHCYFIFCTTEIGKVPTTIQTRCHCYTLEEVSFDDLMDLLEDIVNQEKLELPDKSLDILASEAYGSPRKALVCLSKISGCKNLEEVRSVVRSAHDSVEVIDLCRLLIQGRGLTWKKITTMIKKLGSIEPESIRIVVFNYFTTAALGARSDKEAMRFLTLLGIFSVPIRNKSTGMGELLLSISEVIFEGE